MSSKATVPSRFLVHGRWELKLLDWTDLADHTSLVSEGYWGMALVLLRRWGAVWLHADSGSGLPSCSFAAKTTCLLWMDDHIYCTMAPGSFQLASSRVPHKWLLDFVHSFM